MTISELVDQLYGIRAIHGDLPVYCWPYDGQEEPSGIGELSGGFIQPVHSPYFDGRKILIIDEGEVE